MKKEEVIVLIYIYIIIRMYLRGDLLGRPNIVRRSVFKIQGAVSFNLVMAKPSILYMHQAHGPQL
jgi:hypothetical protein